MITQKRFISQKNELASKTSLSTAIAFIVPALFPMKTQTPKPAEPSPPLIMVLVAHILAFKISAS
jgi:hypothetical protein